MQNDEDFKYYKAAEHQRIDKVIYGAALTAMTAISVIQGNGNSAIFIGAFLWALLSYAYWFFAELHIATHADRDNQISLYKNQTKEKEAKELRDELRLLTNRCRNWNLYTLIISWILNVLGASLTFFHNKVLPHWMGWIIIYGSLALIPIFSIKEHRASDNWSDRFDKL